MTTKDIIQVTVRLPTVLVCNIDTWADRAGISRADFMRNILLRFSHKYAIDLMVFEESDITFDCEPN